MTADEDTEDFLFWWGQWRFLEKSLTKSEDTTEICKNMDESKHMLLSERSQTQNDRFYSIPFVWNARTGKNGFLVTETEECFSAPVNGGIDYKKAL